MARCITCRVRACTLHIGLCADHLVCDRFDDPLHTPGALRAPATTHSKHGRDAEKDADLKAAAKHGSTLAKVIVTQINPYATMCEAATRKMMEEGALAK